MPKKTFNEVLQEFEKDGGMQALGAVATDVVTAASSNSQYGAGQRGKAIGGGIGAGIGTAIGMPGVGQMVGSFIGGVIGGKSDAANMRGDFNDTQRRKYQKLDLSANIDPYGSDNTYYMADGGMPTSGQPPQTTKPITVSDVNDPRLKAYSDSLAIFNFAQDVLKKEGAVGKPLLNTNQASVALAKHWNVKGLSAADAKHHLELGMRADDMPIGYRETNTGYIRPDFKKPVQPVVYQQPVQAKPAKKAVTAKSIIKKPVYAPVYEDTHDMYDISDPNIKMPNLSGLPVTPRGKPNLKQANPDYISSTPTKFSFTTQDDKKTYFKTKAGLQEFLKSARNASSQEGEDYMTATGYMKKGGLVMKRTLSADMMDDGGMPSGQPEAPEKKMVNIEKGEILIDPMTFKVLREYENPNRYKPHAKNEMMEPIGNFTMIDENTVVIPKEYAKRFKNGDTLTKKSIVAEILKNQADNPQQTTRTPHAAEGYYNAGPNIGGPAPGRKLKFNPMIDELPQGGVVPQIDGWEGIPQVNPGALNQGGESNWMNADNSIDIETPAGVASPVGKKAGINKGLLAAKFLSFVPTAYGITNALGTDPYLRYDENTQFENAKAYAQGMETSPNIEASKASIRRSAAGRNKTLNNFNSPSVRAEVGSTNADVFAAEGNIIQGASNLAMEMRNRKRDTLANLEVQQGAGRLDSRRSLANELRADKATRENLIHSGLSELATNYQQGIMDEERIKAINTMAEYYKIDPYSAELLIDQGQFMPKIMESIGRLKGGVPGTAGRMGVSTVVDKTSRDRVGNVKGTQNIVVRKPTK